MALAEAEQALMNTLAEKSRAETEKANSLQNQLQQAQQAVSDLQDKLK